jgi:hypothetical protein
LRAFHQPALNGRVGKAAAASRSASQAMPGHAMGM